MSNSESDLIDGNVDFGSLLAVARKAKNFTLDDICEHLKIPKHVIDAIENNNIEALPPVTFTQGYIRTYAKFLEISEEKVLEIYSRAVPREAPAKLKSRSTLPGEASSQSPLIKAITMLLLVAGISALIYGGFNYYQEKLDTMEVVLESRQPSFTGNSLDYPGDQQLDIKQNARLTSDDQLIVGSPDSSGYADDGSNIDETAISAATETGEIEPLVEETQPEVAAVKDVIEIIAEKGAWVQVRDATNSRLFYNMIPEGGAETLEGEAPFRISLGNADSTRVVLNDIDVNITDLIRRNNTAIFTVSSKDKKIIFH